MMTIHSSMLIAQAHFGEISGGNWQLGFPPQTIPRGRLIHKHKGSPAIESRTQNRLNVNVLQQSSWTPGPLRKPFTG